MVERPGRVNDLVTRWKRRDVTTDPPTEPSVSHGAAAEEYVRRVREVDVSGVETMYLFGSTARAEASGLDSDVDFLVVLSDDVDCATVTDRLRDIVYDVMLEYGPVVEVHTLARSAFERRRDHPFVRRVVDEGRAYG